MCLPKSGQTQSPCDSARLLARAFKFQACEVANHRRRCEAVPGIRNTLACSMDILGYGAPGKTLRTGATCHADVPRNAWCHCKQNHAQCFVSPASALGPVSVVHLGVINPFAFEKPSLPSLVDTQAFASEARNVNNSWAATGKPCAERCTQCPARAVMRSGACASACA